MRSRAGLSHSSTWVFQNSKTCPWGLLSRPLGGLSFVRLFFFEVSFFSCLFFVSWPAAEGEQNEKITDKAAIYCLLFVLSGSTSRIAFCFPRTSLIRIEKSEPFFSFFSFFCKNVLIHLLWVQTLYQENNVFLDSRCASVVSWFIWYWVFTVFFEEASRENPEHLNMIDFQYNVDWSDVNVKND